MKLGIRGHDLGKFTDAISLANVAKDVGFQSIQLVLHKVLENVTGEAGTLTKGFAESIQKDFKATGIETKMLGAYFNIIDGKKAQKDIDKFKEHLKFAKNFGCTLVGSETGSYSKGRVYDPNTNTEAAYQIVLETIKELVSVAEEFDVNVAIEGAWYHVISDCNKLKRLIDDIRSPHLKVIFDLYNLVNINNYLDQRKIIDEAFSLYGDRIVLIHAKDFVVDGDKLKQVSLGEGLYDYDYLIKKLANERPDMTIIFEGVTGEENIRNSYQFIANKIAEYTKKSF